MLVPETRLTTDSLSKSPESTMCQELSSVLVWVEKRADRQGPRSLGAQF